MEELSEYISLGMADGWHWLSIFPKENIRIPGSSSQEMILAFCLITLLVATNTGAQRIKGGPRIVQEPAIQEPHIHVGKGGGGGAALHHTAVVTDPVSLNPVVVEKVTPIGSSGGIKTAGLGQFSVDDSQISSFGPRRLYRVGASSVPFGLSGLDYYSYPRSLLTSPRGLRRKTIVTDNVSGLSPIGFGGRKSAIIADPTTSQFTVGDAQIRTNVFGGRGLYRTGVSSVPFGLSGLDYFSYPNNILSRGSLLGAGLGQTKILSGGGFTSGDAQVSALVADPIGQEKVIVDASPAIVQATQEPEQITTIVEDGGFGQRTVTTVTKPAGGLRGGNIILRGGPALGLRRVKSRPFVQAAAPVQEVLVDSTSGLGAPIGGFGQRQVVAKTVAQAPVVVSAPAPAPVVFSAPAPRPVFVSAPAPVVAAAPVVRRRLGEAFLTQAARPLVAARRVAAFARPVAVRQPQVAVVQQAPPFPGNIQFTLGGTQIIGGGPAIAPASFVSAPRQVVAVQRPVVAVQRPVVAAIPRPVVAAIPRPVVAAVPRPAVVLQQPAVVQRPVVAVQQPVISQVKTAGFGARRVLARRIPQLVYVDGSSRYAGIDTFGGYRIGDPRYNYAQLPISTSRFANLGLSQGSIDAGPILVAPAPAPALLSTKTGGFAAPVAKTTIAQANPLGLTAIGQTSSAKVVTQEEVIGPAGERAVVTTVSDAGPSKIGGLATGGPLGLTAVGQTGGTKTITQEEVIGPAGDSQIVTTVTKSAPSKIGGAAISSPLGLTAVGQSAQAVVTQEEVIGPAGDSQIVTTVTKSAPSKIGGPVIASPFGAIGQTSPAKVVTQEEVIGPAGERAVVTTVSDAGPSKIGGLATGGPLGLAAVGQTGSTKTITQEEVIGPAGDPQVVTTVTQTASAPSKIGGGVVSSPFAAVGQAPTKVITQEEVVGPAGDSQIITTVSETSPVVQQEEEVVGLSPVSSLTASPLSQEIAQDPIETAIAQETLGDSAIISSGSSILSPFSQSAIDPIGSGQTQLSIDDVLAPSSGAVVKETTITEQAGILPDGSVGTTVTKVTEVAQEPIADQVVQQSIDAGGFSGGGLGGYVPRVSFLSSYPYDVPSRALLRQTLTRPIVQEQQQLEQILVR